MSGRRGLGRGNGKSSRGSNSRSAQSSRQSADVSGHSSSAGESASCGSCAGQVDRDGIGCDKCDLWFHPRSMCMGLHSDVIGNIVQHGGNGILYVCVECRVSGSGDSSAGSASPNSGNVSSVAALKQLHSMVTALCAAVRALTVKLDSSSATVVDSNAPHAPPSREIVRTQIREEVIEQAERAKRKESIIVKGLGVSSRAEVQTKFSAIANTLVGHNVLLSDIILISADKDMYRAKILDSDQRQLLLDSSSSLRNKQGFENTYISRDLTFTQRQELFRKRRSRTGDVPSSGGASDVVVVDGLLDDVAAGRSDVPVEGNARRFTRTAAVSTATGNIGTSRP